MALMRPGNLWSASRRPSVKRLARLMAAVAVLCAVVTLCRRQDGAWYTGTYELQRHGVFDVKWVAAGCVCVYTERPWRGSRPPRRFVSRARMYADRKTNPDPCADADWRYDWVNLGRLEAKRSTTGMALDALPICPPAPKFPCPAVPLVFCVSPDRTKVAWLTLQTRSTVPSWRDSFGIDRLEYELRRRRQDVGILAVWVSNVSGSDLQLLRKAHLSAKFDVWHLYDSGPDYGAPSTFEWSPDSRAFVCLEQEIAGPQLFCIFSEEPLVR